jgi:hypothetical protein
MVKSYTRRKFVNKKSKPKPPDQLTQITSATTDYIKQWTQRELGKLQENRDTSICIPTKTGYKIGLYNLRVYPNKTCELFDRNDELVHTFENKVSAILYTIYTIKSKYWIADDILTFDTEINKNYTDMLTLRRGIERARKDKDYMSLDIRQNRLEIAEKQLSMARDKIAKIHRTAKLNKVWE